MKKIKRFVALILCVVILTSTFASIHYETVKSAEWVAGAVASVGGGPLLTALLVGGVVVAGGIAVYEFMQTDSEDYSSFYNGVKTGFNEFVAEQEKQIALEQNSSLSDQEATDIGVANARETVNSFFSNTIDNVKSTTISVKNKVMSYWDSYSKTINDVADNGISETNNDITAISNIKPSAINCTGKTITGDKIVPSDNVGANCHQYDNDWYIYKGNWIDGSKEVSNDFLQPFVELRVRLDEDNNITGSDLYLMYYNAVNNTVTQWKYFRNFGSSNSGIQANINRYSINFKTFIIENTTEAINSFHNNLSQGTNYKSLLSVVASGVYVPTWKRTINTTLNNTHIGKSIQTGRRQLVNSGDYVGSIFVEDSLPIKKSGLKVNEGVASGSIGWDIPANDTWDDYLAGNIPFPDVVGGTGTIVVPKGNVTDYPTDSTVDFPSDTTVTDSYPKVDTDEPNPDTTPDDVVQDQAGSFYPTALDLTNIFPFCIPFDIIYLVQQYANVEEEAPVIDFEIPYPNALKPSLGESYHVEVDFADYVSVRNVLRIFILLLFVVGLMKITRDLIRG